MAKQRADNVDLSYYKQAVFGESPSAPTMQTLRIVSETFKGNKKTVESRVLGGRQIEKIYKIGEDISGSIKGELAHAEWEWAFEGVLGGTFSSVTVTATDISFIAADSSINSAGSGFGSFVAGQWLLISGTANHNGLWYIQTKSSNAKLILSDGVSAAGVTLTVTDESAGASMTVKGKHLRQGTTLNSYTFERRNKDNATFDVWNGYTLDELKLTLKGDQLVEIEVTGQGKVADLDNVATIAGSLTAQSTNDAYNSTNNLMRLKEGSTVLSDELVEYYVTIKSNLRQRLSLGNTTPTGMAQGDVEAMGDMQFYFSDNTRRAVWKNHDETTFYLILNTAGKFTILTIKRNYYQDLTANAEAKNQDVLEKYSFKAAKDATYGQTICVDSLS